MPTRKPMFPNKHLRWGTACALALLATGGLLANNITTSAGSLEDNTGTQVFVQFDISWENGWRFEPDRWDAAWVFVKYRTATGIWQHAQLADTGHEAPAGCTIATGLLTPGSPYDANTNPGIGAFVHRSQEGTGTFTANGVRLLWNYGPSGVGMADVDEIQVFAIEMVYVPQGAFHLGSGGGESGSFTDGAWTSGNTIPLLIASENALPIGPSAGSLWGVSGFSSIGDPGTLPAAFPKGYAAFYCMKYEITQQQYVDFLNTLTRTQQNTRTGTNVAAGVTNVTNRFVMRNSGSLGFRQSIRCDEVIDANAPINFYCDLNGNGTGGEGDDGQWLACNFLNWGDLAAYLDWSGLRPMTELEYEKACRGTQDPVANEYPWGSTALTTGFYTSDDLGAINEGITNNYSTTQGNAMYSTTSGGTPVYSPGRVGIFAAHSGSNGRVSTGAGLYGIMELGGNLWERCVTVGNVNGRNYQGSYGDGMLGGDGHHDRVSWPASTTASGIGLRGGSWGEVATRIRVSDRSLAAFTLTNRGSGTGGRGARGAP